jgi:hypothetical protein
MLHRDRRRRKRAVRRRGRQHDQIDRLRVDPGIGERRARGIDRQMRGELAFGGNVTLPDTGALDDPLVGRIHLRRQFGIGQNPFGQI